MTTDMGLPPEFEAVRDDDESVLWTGKPNFTAFVIRGVPFLIIGLLWGMIDLAFIVGMSSADTPDGMGLFAVPFFLLHSFPCWGSILNMVRLVLVHKNTCYAVTDKRMMMRSGFFGTDFKAIDFDKISDVEVNVNPIENMLNVGTIQAFSGRVSDKGGRIYDKFIGIESPYDVFKMLKQVSVDVKTDWAYPNAIRPEVNPGYRTKYERE